MDSLSASIAEMESLRFGKLSSQGGPGPGSYERQGGVVDNPRKWMVSTTWAKGARGGMADGGVPGPASYEVSAAAGESSPKMKFGSSPRFAEPKDTRCHAYMQIDRQPTPAHLRGTFPRAADRAATPQSPSPGPKYLLPGMGSFEPSPFRRHRTTPAPRFPPQRELSPGPIYSVAPKASRGGVKFPPRSSTSSKLKYLKVPAPLEAAVTVPTATGDNGTRLVQLKGRLIKVFTSSGRTASSSAFGAKTNRDTIFYNTEKGPGPQDYQVQDMKKTPPSYSFGGQQGAVYELHGEQGRKQSVKDVRQRSTDTMPGPGAYVFDSKEIGPSYTIAHPLEVPPKPTPGPSSYKQGYRKTNKPGVPTFSRSLRFTQHEVEAPGPGYYATRSPKRGLRHGVSTTCPDVMGWMEKRKQAEMKHREVCQEASRRMVIMGSAADDMPPPNPAFADDVAERPKKELRTIWY